MAYPRHCLWSSNIGLTQAGDQVEKLPLNLTFLSLQAPPLPVTDWLELDGEIAFRCLISLFPKQPGYTVHHWLSHIWEEEFESRSLLNLDLRTPSAHHILGGARRKTKNKKQHISSRSLLTCFPKHPPGWSIYLLVLPLSPGNPFGSHRLVIAEMENSAQELSWPDDLKTICFSHPG